LLVVRDFRMTTKEIEGQIDFRLLKRTELARALNISPRSVDNFQKAKRIPVIRITPRCVRFSLPAVVKALEKFQVKEAGVK
jgi:hypothetical protein